MQKKNDWGPDEEFIKNYLSLKSVSKMQKLYHCDKATIYKHSREIGFDYKIATKLKRTPRTLSQNEIEKIVSLKGKMSITDIGRKFQITHQRIFSIWREHNVSKGYKDILGQRFGHLEVIRKTDKRNPGGSIVWECKCECGYPECKHYAYATSTELKRGVIVSCGAVGKHTIKKNTCAQADDLTGQNFGKLTALKRVQDKIYGKYRCVNWKCICECGRITYVIADNLRNGNTQSCGYCGNNSHGNNKIDNLLRENNISFQREYRFSDCRYKMPLPFDFFVENKYLIEYDGSQHYNTNNPFYSPEIPIRDKIKSDYAKKHQIPLIRIPYTHEQELCIDDLILETSQFIES